MKGRTAGHPFPENNDVSNSARPRPRYYAWHLLPGVLDNSLSAFIGVGRIAQLVEQLTLNQRVPGSSPGAPTNKFRTADAEITGRDERGLDRLHPSRSSFRFDVKLPANSLKKPPLACLDIETWHGSEYRAGNT